MQKGVSTWENTLGKLPLGKISLGSCHLGKYPWEVAVWERFFGKVPNIFKDVTKQIVLQRALKSRSTKRNKHTNYRNNFIKNNNQNAFIITRSSYFGSF